MVISGWMIKVTCSFNIVLLFFMYQCPGNSCPKGRFGANCRYMCYCRENTCDVLNGSCLKGVMCIPGMFGPSCQYKNIANYSALTEMHRNFFDNNDITCQMDAKFTLLAIYLAEMAPIYWIRLVGEDMSKMDSFVLKFNDDNYCVEQKTTVVNSFTRDVTCSKIFRTSTIFLEGNFVTSICSIYISGGRNIAVFQKVSMSTNFVSDSLLQVPINPNIVLVDSDKKSCIQTKYEEKPTIEFEFPQPAAILTVNVHGLLTGNETHRGNITIALFSLENKLVQNYVVTAINNFTISFTPINYSMYTKITIQASVGHLILCDVTIMGELLCPDYKWGFECNNKCNCSGGCLAATGACISSCEKGRYGFGCKLNCPSFCPYTKCTPNQGLCSQCKPGFMGAKCDEACNESYYGESCLEPCATNCLNNACDSETGYCACVNGYRGNKCTDCPVNKFGVDCNQTCSPYCTDQICNNHGICSSCISGRSGDFCDKTDLGLRLMKFYSAVSAIVLCSIGLIVILYLYDKFSAKKVPRLTYEDESTDNASEITEATTLRSEPSGEQV